MEIATAIAAIGYGGCSTKKSRVLHVLLLYMRIVQPVKYEPMNQLADLYEYEHCYAVPSKVQYVALKYLEMIQV